MKSTTITYGGLKLERINQVNEFVPTTAHKIELSPKDRKALAIGIKENIPVLIVGETGTGKTSAVKELALKLKQGYTRISLTGFTSPDDLIGSKSAKDGSTYYENGILTKAMLEGHICVLDELNAITPECSFIMHGLLDDDRRIALPNGDIITPHKDFRLFSTINPEYEGTRSLNRAFLDRFGIIVYIDMLKPITEIKLLKDRAGITEELAKQLVALAWLNRKAYNEHKTLTLISTRSLLQLVKLHNEGLDIKEAYIASIVNKARMDERKAFLDFYNLIFKTDEEYNDYLPEVITPEQSKARENELNELNKNLHESNQKQYEYMNEAHKKEEQLQETRKLNQLLEEKIQELQKRSTSLNTPRSSEALSETPEPEPLDKLDNDT